MINFHLPESETLQALGKIALRHSQLDYILRMTIKSLTGVTVQEVLDATSGDLSAELRRRIGRIARQVLGEGTDLIRLQALLEQCRRVTEKRNEYLHNIWGRELDGDPMVSGRNPTWGPPPDIQTLEDLAGEMERLVQEINEARLSEGGFLFEALKIRGRNREAEGD